MDRRSLNAKLAKAESLLTDGERHIAARRKMIGRLSAVGAEADPMRELLGYMERAQKILLKCRDQLRDKLSRRG